MVMSIAVKVGKTSEFPDFRRFFLKKRRQLHTVAFFLVKFGQEYLCRNYRRSYHCRCL